jgi:hypothetical protein
MAQEVLKYDPHVGLGETDRILLRGAASNKSPRELAVLSGGQVTPEEAITRVLDILDSRDWLSVAQAKMLLVDQMHELKDALMERAIEFKSVAAAIPLVAILTLIEKTISAEKLDLSKAMNEISRAHGYLMLQAINVTLERTFLALEKRYPQIEKAELMEVFEQIMPHVVAEIERHTVDG